MVHRLLAPARWRANVRRDRRRIAPVPDAAVKKAAFCAFLEGHCHCIVRVFGRFCAPPGYPQDRERGTRRVMCVGRAGTDAGPGSGPLGGAVDVNLVARAGRAKRLLIADMGVAYVAAMQGSGMGMGTDGQASSSSSSSSSSETQGASAKHAAKRRPGKLAAVQEQANGGDGSGGGDREDEEQARARALAPQTKPAVVAARSSARKVEGPTRVKVAEVSERAIRERSPSQQSSSSSGDVASSASAPDAKPMSRFKARRLQQKQEEQQQQGL